MEGFTPASPPRIFWNSRKRPASGRSSEKAVTEECPIKAQEERKSVGGGSNPRESPDASDGGTTMDTEAAAAAAEDPMAGLSERRKALFEPLEPAGGGPRMSNEALLPPPDFETASYPKGWLVGKKRKLVNVDVVESMRRIAVQEMNRKDREIDGLNEQLEEDARCVEHLQMQLLEERRKRAEAERENAVLQNQITMLMDMLQDGGGDGEDMGAPPEHC